VYSSSDLPLFSGETSQESRQIADSPVHEGMLAAGTIGGVARKMREERDSRDV